MPHSSSALVHMERMDRNADAAASLEWSSEKPPASRATNAHRDIKNKTPTVLMPAAGEQFWLCPKAYRRFSLAFWCSEKMMQPSMPMSLLIAFSQALCEFHTHLLEQPL